MKKLRVLLIAGGVKGQGGMKKATAKEHAFEDKKAGETKAFLDVASAG